MVNMPVLDTPDSGHPHLPHDCLLVFQHYMSHVDLKVRQNVRNSSHKYTLSCYSTILASINNFEQCYITLTHLYPGCVQNALLQQMCLPWIPVPNDERKHAHFNATLASHKRDIGKQLDSSKQLDAGKQLDSGNQRDINKQCRPRLEPRFAASDHGRHCLH